jgi:hypothetical protein
VVDFTTVRLALALAQSTGAYVDHLDVTGAFLYGTLKEELYMSQPQGFEQKGKEQFVCKLKKSLYGLKQAPRVWHKHLSTELAKMRFESLDYAPSVFVRSDNGETILMLVYVDDMLLVTTSAALLKQVKNELKRVYKMTDLGAVKYFLGVHVKRSQTKTTLNQTGFINEILNKYNMQESKPVVTPMDPGQYSALTEQKGSCQEENMIMNNCPYREAVGQVLYLSTRTRPDIAATVGVLSRHVSNPRPVHWAAMKRLLRYLKGTKEYELVLSPTNNILTGHADADWAGGTERTSVSGHVITIGGATVAWKSNRQRSIALSSTEAEYMSASEIAREITWLRYLLKELGYEQNDPTAICQDNTGAIGWIQGTGQFRRNKHIDIRIHHIRELCENKTIETRFVPTQEMMADVMTKPLYRNKHEAGTRLLGLFIKIHDDNARCAAVRLSCRDKIIDREISRVQNSRKNIFRTKLLPKSSLYEFANHNKRNSSLNSNNDSRYYDLGNPTQTATMVSRARSTVYSKSSFCTLCNTSTTNLRKSGRGDEARQASSPNHSMNRRTEDSLQLLRATKHASMYKVVKTDTRFRLSLEGDNHHVQSLSLIDQKVKATQGTQIDGHQVTAFGTVEVTKSTGDVSEVQDVAVLPTVEINALSLKKFISQGKFVIFYGNHRCEVRKEMNAATEFTFYNQQGIWSMDLYKIVKLRNGRDYVTEDSKNAENKRSRSEAFWVRQNHIISCEQKLHEAGARRE